MVLAAILLTACGNEESESIAADTELDLTIATDEYHEYEVCDR